MKYRTIYSAVLSLCLVAGSAIAQDRNDHDDRDRGQARPERSDQGSAHGSEQRRDQPAASRGRNDRDDYQVRDDHRGNSRGAGPRHDMRKGQRVPAEYRTRQYVVDDWRGHHLSAPPRGQHWVQAGGDYVLVAIATGVIASVLLNN